MAIVLHSGKSSNELSGREESLGKDADGPIGVLHILTSHCGLKEKDSLAGVKSQRSGHLGDDQSLKLVLGCLGWIRARTRFEILVVRRL